MQARWPAEQVKIEGRSRSWSQLADSGNRATFHFCPDCGSDVYYLAGNENLMAIPLGAFDDPYFASPKFSVWEKRKCNWVEILGDAVEHRD